MFCSCFLSPPPPQALFSKTLSVFHFFMSFFFFLSSLSTFHVFFHQPVFRYYSRFVSLALWTDRSERPRLENTFSYHMGLRGWTWEDGPQSAVFSACLHPEFHMNLCYNRSGIEKRVIFQKGGFGGQDPWLALGFFLFGFLSPFDLEKPWLFFFAFLVIHQPFRANILVFLARSYPLFSFYLCWVCCFFL